MKIGPPNIVTPNVKISIIMIFVNINHKTTNKVYKYSCLSDRQARDFSFIKRDSSTGKSILLGQLFLVPFWQVL